AHRAREPGRARRRGRRRGARARERDPAAGPARGAAREEALPTRRQRAAPRRIPPRGARAGDPGRERGEAAPQERLPRAPRPQGQELSKRLRDAVPLGILCALLEEEGVMASADLEPTTHPLAAAHASVRFPTRAMLALVVVPLLVALGAALRVET